MEEEDYKKSAEVLQEDIRTLASEELVSEEQLKELRARLVRGIEVAAKRRRKTQGWH